MKRLDERISIDIWKVIADRVQKLDIDEFSDESFNENLVILREMLSDLDISLDFHRRYPACDREVGLASLLNAIYFSDVDKSYRKANLYEKIYQLGELGIPAIEFRPINFPIKVEGISLLKDEQSGENVGIKSCFTDGEFDIGYVDIPLNRRYDLINLKEANFILRVLLELDTVSREVIVNLDESYAVLKNFNGNFPNKESFLDIRYPGLCSYFKDLDDDGRQLILKQIFFTFDRNTTRYSRKLVRTRGNYHYE